ncbi:MAG TPA: hypothetical protein VIB48_04375 [Acidimicrobiia bacterium]|jgi:predicted metal-dependent enzyme (double-stranded beta helix superfamily)
MRGFDVDEFVNDCRLALTEHTPQVAAKEVVERAVADPAAIDATLGSPNTGGITTLHRGPEVTVLWIVWPPGVRLFPHDHRMWAANGIYAGREDNTFYRRTAGAIAASGNARLDATETLLLGADAIHAVENPTARYTAAIHVYGGDYFAAARIQWDPTTLVEEPFDVERVRSVLRKADEAARG